MVHLEDDEGGSGELLLFVALAPGATDDGDPRRAASPRPCASELSPRHVPDRLEVVPAIPRTLSGKKLEVPVKRILTGTPPEQAVSADALVDPTAHPAVRRSGRGRWTGSRAGPTVAGVTRGERPARTIRYREIAEDLRARIDAGEFGERRILPSESELSQRYEASRVTVRKALETLRSEGLVDSRQGFGWFVAGAPFRQHLGPPGHHRGPAGGRRPAAPSAASSTSASCGRPLGCATRSGSTRCCASGG